MTPSRLDWFKSVASEFGQLNEASCLELFTAIRELKKENERPKEIAIDNHDSYLIQAGKVYDLESQLLEAKERERQLESRLDNDDFNEDMLRSQIKDLESANARLIQKIGAWQSDLQAIEDEPTYGDPLKTVKLVVQSMEVALQPPKEPADGEGART